jgi:NTP pyrophosphatase (non-canonical NTP hydrolase)
MNGDAFVEYTIVSYIGKFGLTNSLDVCVEELAELIQAIMKHNRFIRAGGEAVIREPDHGKLKKEIFNEYIDVLFTLEYVKVLLDMSDEEIEDALYDKVAENQRRLEEC